MYYFENKKWKHLINSSTFKEALQGVETHFKHKYPSAMGWLHVSSSNITTILRNWKLLFCRGIKESSGQKTNLIKHKHCKNNDYVHFNINCWIYTKNQYINSQILLNQLLPLFVLSNSDENQNPFLQHSTKALQRE